MQSWKQPVDCTTFETKTQSGGSKPNENLIPDKVYCLRPGQHPDIVDDLGAERLLDAGIARVGNDHHDETITISADRTPR